MTATHVVVVEVREEVVVRVGVLQTNKEVRKLVTNPFSVQATMISSLGLAVRTSLTIRGSAHMSTIALNVLLLMEPRLLTREGSVEVLLLLLPLL